MPVFKDEARGTWYVMVRYQDWTGERKQKCKRGFATKREAQEWERSFQMQTSGDLDMTFEAFTELYTKDMPRPDTSQPDSRSSFSSSSKSAGFCARALSMATRSNSRWDGFAWSPSHLL